jgi:two-component system sensor histidine kinase DesK
VAVAVLERDEAWGITVLCVLSYLTALSIVVSRRTFVIATAALTVIPPAVSLAWPAIVSTEMRLTWLTVMTVGSVSVWCGGRGSLWMLGIVRELDRARGVQSRLAVAEERLRFSRDLHDVVGRGLSVVALKSELAARLAERADPGAAGEMLEVGRVAQDLLTEVREVARGYRTVDLDAELAGARSVLAAAGIQCRTLGEAGDLPPDVQTTLGWVVREGTTNVLRHSDAHSCTISVRRDGSGPVVLTMENDGVRDARGTEAPRLGSGLLGLAERLTALGGSVVAQPLTAQRFRLIAHVPVVGL